MPSTSSECDINRPSKQRSLSTILALSVKLELSSTLEQSYPPNRGDQFPDDVLGKIFLTSLEMYQQSCNSLFTEPGEDKPPIIFCRVCDHWTKVALSLPKLWASISAVPEQCGGKWRLPETTLRCWLGMSKNCKLSFRLILGCDPKVTGAKEVLRLLGEHDQRWQMVNVSVERAYAMNFLEVSTPGLEKIEIRTQEWEKEMLDSLVSKLAKCSQLSSLKLTCTGCFRPSFAKIGDWSSLSIMQISSEITIKDTVDLLQACNKVRRVEVDIQDHIGNPPMGFPRMVHSELSSLVVYASGELTALWNHLSAPGLKSLRIYQCARNTLAGPEREAFCKFIGRSKCRLEEFFLKPDNLSEADITAYLRASDGAQQVIIQTQNITEDALQSMNTELLHGCDCRQSIRNEEGYTGWSSERGAFCEFTEQLERQLKTFLLKQKNLSEAGITAYLRLSDGVDQAIIQTQNTTKDGLWSRDTELWRNCDCRRRIRKERDYVGWTSARHARLLDAWEATKKETFSWI